MTLSVPKHPLLAQLVDLGPATRHAVRIQGILDTIAWFEDFDADDINFLAAHMHCFSAAPGREIIREGEVGDFMVLVLSGTINVVRLDRHGMPMQVATAGPGRVLGEMSLIDGELRFASCFAEDEVEIAVMNREGLSHLITERPMVGVKLMMEFLIQLNQRLRQSSKLLMDAAEDRRPLRF